MRGTYRISLLVRRIKMQVLTAKANQRISKFPTISKKVPHGLPNPLIVTVTSYPPRFKNLSRTLKSILDQNVIADETILWIANKDVPLLPKDVLALKSHGLTIKACDDIKSYKKLIPALSQNPKNFFVTADDDVYYPPTWLQSLVETSKEYPRKTIAGRAHLASLDKDGAFKRYSTWSLATHLLKAQNSQTRLFPTGVGGILYPPDCFHEDIQKEELFMKLAPHGDDIWFFWMTRKAGIDQRRTSGTFDIISWPDSQDVALYNDNLNNDGNDMQIKAMEEYYGPTP